MNRKEDRIKKCFEKNPILECNKVQKKYCSKLFHRFSETIDPRHQSYTEYLSKTMLGTLYFKGFGRYNQ